MLPTEHRELSIEEYRVTEEPYYLPIRDEVDVFGAAFRCRIPVLLKGPTGTGKTRFVEYMAHALSRERNSSDSQKFIPLITVACHEDLTSTDLLGRYLLKGDETVWMDGPLTRAVKAGAICYLDEIVEARKDTTVIIHPLSDYRRMLPLDKKGALLEAHPNFQLVISYNPGYQSATKDLKQSTRQRFVAIEFDYPPRDQEARIVRHETGVDEETGFRLATVAQKIRNLKGHALTEGASTRLLVYAGRLICEGIAPRRACRAAITCAITDDETVQRALEDVISAVFPE